MSTETTMLVTNKPQKFVWGRHGLRLNVQEGTLPSDVEQCTINIKASIAGQYDFPENMHLVSAVYWLRCEPRCKFTQPVSLEIQHCAKQANVSKLSFVKALCSQQDLPYTFKKQHKGSYFSNNDSYGIIEMESFSGVAITQEGTEDREYIAQLFYLCRTISNYDIDLVVTWNDEEHLSVSVPLHPFCCFHFDAWYGAHPVCSRKIL